MRLAIVAVGRLRPGPERTLFEHYAARIRWPLAVHEVEERRKLPKQGLIAREGELLRAACPKGAKIIALDGAGKALTSEALARRLGTWRDEAVDDVALVIGGADGLDPSIVAAADVVLSFGAVTWPHLLMRALVAEQIYRAQQILAGHPYHRS
jgi:23S rRNA (pseudouridine1915-N3)-methyltransferase